MRISRSARLGGICLGTMPCAPPVEPAVGRSGSRAERSLRQMAFDVLSHAVGRDARHAGLAGTMRVGADDRALGVPPDVCLAWPHHAPDHRHIQVVQVSVMSLRMERIYRPCRNTAGCLAGQSDSALAADYTDCGECDSQ